MTSPLRVRGRTVALAVTAVGVTGLAASPAVAQPCEARVTFKNPYPRPVLVDLDQSRVQSRIPGVSLLFGPKRRLGTGVLRVNGRSRLVRSFPLQLGCNSEDARRYTWVVRHLGVEYRTVQTAYRTFVRVLQLPGMPAPPAPSPPVVLTGPTSVVSGTPAVFTWRGEVGAEFQWWLLDSSPGNPLVRSGRTRTRSASVPTSPLVGYYQFQVRQTEGSGLLQSGWSSPRRLVQFTPPE